jgi:hypothetical protein
LQVAIGGKLIVFQTHQDEKKHKGHRVVCPVCANIVDRGKAKRHFTSHHDKVSKGDAGGIQNNDSDTFQSDEPDGVIGGQSENKITSRSKATSRKRQRNDEDSLIWKKFCGGVPPNILETTMATIPATAYHISGHTLIMSPSSLSFVQSILIPGKTLS